MKYKLFTIKDIITGEYSMPIPMLNEAEFLRGAKQMANSPKPNNVNVNINDKQLWEIGEYDQQTAEITPNKMPRFIINALDLRETRKETPTHDKNIEQKSDGKK